MDNALLPEGLNHYKYAFIFAMVFIGMGATPLYTLGVAYLDENLKTKMSPVYIGQYLSIVAGSYKNHIGCTVQNRM